MDWKDRVEQIKDKKQERSQRQEQRRDREKHQTQLNKKDRFDPKHKENLRPVKKEEEKVEKEVSFKDRYKEKISKKVKDYFNFMHDQLKDMYQDVGNVHDLEDREKKNFYKQVRKLWKKKKSDEKKTD